MRYFYSKVIIIGIVISDKIVVIEINSAEKVTSELNLFARMFVYPAVGIANIATGITSIGPSSPANFRMSSSVKGYINSLKMDPIYIPLLDMSFFKSELAREIPIAIMATGDIAPAR